MAEAIRQGIDQLKKAKKQQTYRQLAENTRGIWKQGDGLAYQEKLRAEWE